VVFFCVFKKYVENQFFTAFCVKYVEYQFWYFLLCKIRRVQVLVLIFVPNTWSTSFGTSLSCKIRRVPVLVLPLCKRRRVPVLVLPIIEQASDPLA
jgi:hypothetical protein